MGRKKWQLVAYDKTRAQNFARSMNEDAFALLLLLARGYSTPEEINGMLRARELTLSSPYLLRDMNKAADRIRAALDNEERILVYGDYDCDGVTATALLYTYLQTLGADVDYYIPSRERDGYGLSEKTVNKIIEGGFSLVVTVDNGIAAVDEAAVLRENGVSLVITDHHQAGELLPHADAVVDPHRPEDRSPCKDLAGVGVALKLCAALENEDYSLLLEDYLDLVTLGTVADIVPLKGENRALVANGLEAIKNTSRPGLRALMDSVGLGDKEITSASVAFQLAPRINAAGRMGDADAALELLLTEDEEEANRLVSQLNDLNAQRQRTEGEILEAVRTYLAADPRLSHGRVIVAAGKDWHPGVIGIVAARLVEAYGKPAAVISIGEDGVCRGSARSVEGFMLYDALNAVSDTLLQFGGHAQAAGFSLTEAQIPAFRDAINDYARAQGDVYPSLTVDCRLNPAHITVEVLDSLKVLEPFGAGNPQPVFGLFGVEIVSVKPIGGNKHIRLTVAKNGVTVPTVYFGVSAQSFPYRAGDKIDLAIKIEKNEYMGETRLSLQIRDVRPADNNDDALFRSVWSFHAAVCGEQLPQNVKKALLPDRALCGRVFKQVKQDGGCNAPDVLTMRLGLGAGRTGSVMAALYALTELGVLDYTDGVWRNADKNEKSDLSESVLLQFLSAP